MASTISSMASARSRIWALVARPPFVGLASPIRPPGDGAGKGWRRGLGRPFGEYLATGGLDRLLARPLAEDDLDESIKLLVGHVSLANHLCASGAVMPELEGH